MVDWVWGIPTRWLIGPIICLWSMMRLDCCVHQSIGLGYLNPMIDWTRHVWYFNPLFDWTKPCMIQGYSIPGMTGPLIHMYGIPTQGWLGQTWVLENARCCYLLCGGILGELTKLWAYSLVYGFRYFGGLWQSNGMTLHILGFTTEWILGDSEFK